LTTLLVTPKNLMLNGKVTVPKLSSTKPLGFDTHAIFGTAVAVGKCRLVGVVHVDMEVDEEVDDELLRKDEGEGLGLTTPVLVTTIVVLADIELELDAGTKTAPQTALFVCAAPIALLTRHVPLGCA
jgi:hypothetical protein